MTYSVHVHPLGDLFRKYGTFRSFTLYTYLPIMGVFSITTTSSWLILYTWDFSAFLYIYFLVRWWLYGWYIMGYMWTFLWWPILYTYTSEILRLRWRVPLETYSVYKDLLDDLFSTQTFPRWRILDQNTPCTRDYFGLFCKFISPWWAILYWSDMTVLLPLATYSVHIPPLGDLFCTYGSF